jgi:hypothetical protein
VSANLPVAVGDEATADLLNELCDSLWSASFLRTTGASPLVSSANTKTSILTGSFDFVSGYAYEISIQCRFTIDITASTTAVTEARALFNITRTNAAGTSLYGSGYEGTTEDNAPLHFYASQIVKVTAGDTTQTLSFNGQYSSNLSAASMAISVNGSTTPARMTIKRIGLAANHADAIELPTA